MTVGSFTSVSLDPPLVAFLPDKSSSSWRSLRESGDTFCVNVLGAAQEDICRAIAVRKSNKFEGIDWRPSPAGNPVITGSVAFIDCTVEAVHDAGDHHIVLGRVRRLDVENTSYPLLFFRGGYGSFTPTSLAAVDADLLDYLRLVDLARPHMEQLAARLDTEVTAVTLVRNELVLAAAAGKTAIGAAPTRVGMRVPFMPPLGSVFAAWGGEGVLERWLAQLDRPSRDQEVYRAVPGRVRSRGYAITVGHEKSARVESMSTRLAARDPDVSPDQLRDAIRELAVSDNPEVVADDVLYELGSLSAPVFHADGRLAFSLTLWGPPGEVTGATAKRWGAELLATAAAGSAAIRHAASSVSTR
jgi:flavin reductase (DIM6/NTAB) family NADH-FMN oxidoreductase RutF/DNA-binding IclR family transcriptional regulator